MALPGCEPPVIAPPELDAASQRWLAGLCAADGARRDRVLGELHALLLRAARFEVGRRRSRLEALGSRELEDLAHQAADDALLAISRRLHTYRGASRFTTWAYTFVWHEASVKMRGHLRVLSRATLEETDWEHLPDRLVTRPERRAEALAQLAALRRAVEEELTPRQREVFVAVALNEAPLDAVAARLGATRGAVYKTLHDARRRLRSALEGAGYPLDSAAA